MFDIVGVEGITPTSMLQQAVTPFTVLPNQAMTPMNFQEFDRRARINRGDQSQGLIDYLMRGSHKRQAEMPQVVQGIFPDFTKGALGVGAASRIAKALPRSQRGFIAYHSSPHHFDQFKIAENMGRGEGNQAFGHGGYFAQSNRVSGRRGTYRKMFGEEPGVALVGDKEIPSWVAKEVRAGNLNGVFSQFQGRLTEIERKIASPDAVQPWLLEGQRQNIQGVLSALDDVTRGAKIKMPGHTYKVRIKADPADLLDLDLPLSRQGQNVQANLADVLRWQKIPRKDPLTGVETTGRDVMAALQKIGDPKAAFGDSAIAGQKFAADEVHSMGIPGLKYLDGMSRRGGQGTRNIVMFPGTEHLIEILKKYGVVGPAAGLGALGLGQQDEGI